MAKNYIYQLAGGKMLVYQDGWFGVENTGYPLPDCSLHVGNMTFTKKDDILRAILGYDITDIPSFVATVSTFEPMVYEDFKYKVQMENIGGGCSKKLQKIAVATHDMGLSTAQAVFKYILPVSCVDEACVLPSESDLLSEYEDLLRYDWSAYVHNPDWRFRNNMILFTGIREVTQKHFEFMQDVVSICMASSERPKYRYMSGITLSNGNGAIVLTDSYIGNCDVAFLYQRVTGVDLSIGKIVATEESDAVKAHFEYVDKTARRRRMPELSGVVERMIIR